MIINPSCLLCDSPVESSLKGFACRDFEDTEDTEWGGLRIRWGHSPWLRATTRWGRYPLSLGNKKRERAEINRSEVTRHAKKGT
jgi:hypothetical protein